VLLDHLTAESADLAVPVSGIGSGMLEGKNIRSTVSVNVSRQLSTQLNYALPRPVPVSGLLCVGGQAHGLKQAFVDHPEGLRPGQRGVVGFRFRFDPQLHDNVKLFVKDTYDSCLMTYRE
jgi:hypothetical protein